MNRTGFGFVVGPLLVLALAVGCGGGGGDAAVSGDAAGGHQVFKQVCSICHGQDDEGMPMLGKDLRGNEFVASQGDEELVEFLKEGRPATHPDNDRGVDMPPRGGNPTITDEQLAQVVAYLRTL